MSELLPPESKEGPFDGVVTYALTRGVADRIAGQVSSMDHRIRDLKLDESNSRPFTVITPLGMPQKDTIASLFARFGIHISKRMPISHWSPLATLLYVRHRHEKRLLKAAAFERLWDSGYPHQGEVWELADWSGFEQLVTNKYVLRGQFPSMRMCVHIRTENPTDSFRFHANLRAFHVPDRVRIPVEWWLKENYENDNPDSRKGRCCS